MDIFIPIFIFFTVFVLFSLCGFCCKSKNEGAIFSTPVVITSQTHQPVGSPSAYPVHGHINTTTNVHSNHHQMPVAPSMPMPYSDHSAPYPPMPYPAYPPTSSGVYPPTSSGGYPPAPSGGYPPTPYGHHASTAPYPPTAPYPSQPASHNQALNDQQPPAYNEVVFNEIKQKQAPYNPHYTG